MHKFSRFLEANATIPGGIAVLISLLGIWVADLRVWPVWPIWLTLVFWGFALAGSLLLLGAVAIHIWPQKDRNHHMPWRSLITNAHPPPSTPNFVERPHDIDKLRAALTTNQSNGEASMTALVGMGGIGKTVLARAICDDACIRRRFPDGALWFDVGEKPTHWAVSTKIREIARTFGEELSYDNLSDDSASQLYRDLLRDKSALVIVDNIWNADDLEPYRFNSARSHLLFTTRDASIASSTSSTVVTPEILKPDESRAMLAKWSGLSVDALPPIANELLKECGGLPLALAIVGAMLRGKLTDFWGHVYALLKNADLTRIQQKVPGYPYPNLFPAFKVSVDLLDQKMRTRYYALAVILEGMTIHPLIQGVLWNSDQAVTLDAREELIRLALAQRAGSEGSIRLHDLLLKFLRTEYPDHLSLDFIHGAMRLSSRVFERDPKQFCSQLVGRLLYHAEIPAIHDFIEALVKAAPRPWLRPLFPSLRPPGTGLLRILEGHTKSVNAVAITPDGRLAVSGSDDHTVKIWDLETGCALRTLKGHVGAVLSVAVLKSNRRSISGSVDRTIKIWDLDSGRTLRTLEGHAGFVEAVTVTSDGRCVVSGSRDHTVIIWHLESGRVLQTLNGHSDSVEALAVTPDDRRIVSASRDKTLKVWDLKTGLILRTLEGHTDWVQAVAVTRDDRCLSASRDKTLKVWDLDTGRALHTLEGHRA